MRNILFVLSGPSGAGKGTIAKMLVKRNPNILLSVSCTTRAPRNGETDGKDYYFISKDEFETKIKSESFLEYSQHFGNYYGTPKKAVEESLQKNDILLEIDVNGGLNVKKSFEQAILIMILPPSLEEVKNRLIKRQSETEESIKLRMSRIEYEIEKKKFYDYAVVNDNLMTAVAKIEEIINKEKNR